jgi:hypothetical protein
MKSLVVGFSRPLKMKLKPYAWLIMKFDKTNYDHCYLRFPSSSWGCDFIYQSSGSRTNFMSGNYFVKINVEVEEYILEVDDDTYNKIGNLCVTREGGAYPVMEIVGIALVKTLMIITFGKVKMKNPFSSKETDCIEEAAAILSGGLGIDCPFDLEDSTVKPFRDWVVSIPNIKLISGAK